MLPPTKSGPRMHSPICAPIGLEPCRESEEPTWVLFELDNSEPGLETPGENLPAMDRSPYETKLLQKGRPEVERQPDIDTEALIGRLPMG